MAATLLYFRGFMTFPRTL